MSRPSALAVLATLAACPSSQGGGRDAGGPPRVVVESGGRAHSVTVEVAADPAARERGLMYRQRLEPDRGMLFVFDREGEQSFWMKNTLVALDMIFISGEGRVVGIVHRAEPLTLTPRVGGPCRYVLEVVGGWAEAQGVAVGDRIRFENLGLRRFE